MRYFVYLGPEYLSDITCCKLYTLELSYAISDNNGNIFWVEYWKNKCGHVVEL